ncbi:MAG: hypothetical protein FJ125_01640 [Deltaproteobacteria bacterium]|nr:hypothetical protein [Deltaproteobacteria bacterium]
MVARPFQRYDPVVIGQGSLGVTCRGRDPVQHGPVALKILRPEKLRDPLALERLHRVCAAWQGLQHPGVVRLHRLEEEGSWTALIMELVRGATLTRLLFDQRLKPGSQACWLLCQQLLEIFHYSSARGVTHGSLSPADVFLEPEPGGGVRLKVTDFGLAAALAGRRPPPEEDMPAVANVAALLLTGQPIVLGMASGPAGALLARAAAERAGERPASFRVFHAELTAVSPVALPATRLATPAPSSGAAAAAKAAPAAPAVPPAPVAPAVPAAPAVPVAPVVLAPATSVPTLPAVPAAPAVPIAPVVLAPATSVPTLPAVPAVPAVPIAPVVLAPATSVPTLPAVPAVPAVPLVPTAPFVPPATVVATVASLPSARGPSTPGAVEVEAATLAALAEGTGEAAAAAPSGGIARAETEEEATVPLPSPSVASPSSAEVAAAPAARPSRARRSRPSAPAGGAAQVEIPESLRLALDQDEQQRALAVAVAKPEGQEDPFAVTARPAVAGDGAPPAEKEQVDWVQQALAKPPARVAPPRGQGQPSLVHPASLLGAWEVPPEPAVAPAPPPPVRRGPPPQPIAFLLVGCALLLVISSGAVLAWLLRSPTEQRDDVRSAEETEERALQRVMGIGAVPAREKGKVPVGVVAVPERGDETIPPPSALPAAGARTQLPDPARVLPVDPGLGAALPGPSVVRIPGGPEIPTSPFAPQVGVAVGATRLPVIPLGSGVDAAAAPAPGQASPLTLPAASTPPAPPAPAAPAVVPGREVGPAGPPVLAPVEPWTSRAAAPLDKRASLSLNAEGLAAYKRGSHDRALQLYLQAVQADPTYHWPYYNAACMYALQRDPVSAIQYLEGYLKYSPRKVDIYSQVYKDSDFNNIILNPLFKSWLDRHNR